MPAKSFPRWRFFVLLGGLLITAGGPMHPGGSMAEMLADPRWVPGHTLTTLGFAALLAGLVMLARAGTVPPSTARWLRFAIAGTAVQALEMVLHTAASVDHGNLVAGHATPVLSTHLAMAVVAHPVFGATIIAFILAAARDRVLGSRWIAPLGILGAAAHGAAAPLVVLGGDERFRVLFPGLALFSVWAVIAALWRARADAPASTPAARRSSPQAAPAGR